ncbi:MAG: SpoIIE family protein phosphatase [Acidobacteriota bacterium]
MAQIVLRVTPSEADPFDRVVDCESLIIGRSSKAALSIMDPLLSREHARLFLEGGAWYVEDLKSHNGTFVHGKRIQERSRVAPGDVIAMGATTIRLRAEEAEAPEAPPCDEQYLDGTLFRPATQLLMERRITETALKGEEDETLRKYVQRLSLLNEVHHALARPITLDELLGLILDRVFDHLRPEKGTIFLKATGDEYYCAASRSVDAREQDRHPSRSLIREVVEKGMAALVLDVQMDERFSAAASIQTAGVRSLIAAPLLDSEGALGMIVLSSKIAVKQFTEEDMELLVSLASVAALRIRNVALAEEAAERRRLQEEVALARSIQLALLPAKLPPVPGYEVYGGNLPSRGVSGDYFQVVERKEGSECVVWVADVSGKGIAAAMLMASLEALSAGPIQEGLAPNEICNRVCRLLARRTLPEKYVTAFIAALDVASGTLTYANAGHCQALVVRHSGDAEWLGPTGIPLAVLPEWDYASAEIGLAPGELLVLYTDGVTEALSAEGEEYGQGRLLNAAVAHRSDPLDAMVGALEADLEAFAQGVPFADDRTMVIVRRLE